LMVLVRLLKPRLSLTDGDGAPEWSALQCACGKFRCLRIRFRL